MILLFTLVHKIMLFFVIPTYCQEFIVSLQKGKIQGTTITSFKGREIFAFYKIPYANPPVNESRFKVSFLKVINIIVILLYYYYNIIAFYFPNRR